MPHPADVQAGSRLRLTRIARGLSQSDLAERVGVSYQQIQKYERGINRLTASMMTKLATALNVAAASFLDGSDPSDSAPRIGDPTAQAIRLARAFDEISDETARQRILQLVMALAASQPPREARHRLDENYCH